MEAQSPLLDAIMFTLSALTFDGIVGTLLAARSAAISLNIRRMEVIFLGL